MNNELSYNKKAMRNYILICVGLIALSFIGLIFHEWVIPVMVTICSILGSVVMLLLLKTNLTPESNKGTFLLALAVRYLVMGIGLVGCAFLIKYTMGDPIVKERYLMLILGALPYFSPSVAVLLSK